MGTSTLKPMTMTMLTLTPRSHNSRHRRRRRSVSVPQMLLVSVVPILLGAMLTLPTATFSWTSPYVARNPPKTTATTTTTGSSCSIDRRRSFPFQATEDSIGSVGATFSPPSVSSSTMLSSAVVSSADLSVEAAAQSSLIAPTPPAIHEIAIVLNTNAKGVTEDLIEAARDVVEQHNIIQANSNNKHHPRVRLLVTSTYDEAKSASREIMSTAANANANANATTMVIPVGGDGTLTAMINLLWEEHRSIISFEQQQTDHSSTTNGSDNSNSNDKDINNSNGNGNSNNNNNKNNFPIIFGYVAMGTGNALGSVVGCRAVTPNPKRKRKRTRALRLMNKCLRPQTTKREDFGLVLSQLIEAAARTNPKTQTRTTVKRGEQLTPKPSDPIEVDVVELPLIRVRTDQGGTDQTATNGNGILSNGSSDDTKNNNINDRYAFFAGLGYDSLLLQDYKDLQDWTTNNNNTKSSRHLAGLWQVATTGVVGYTLAMVTRSLPKLLQLKDASRLLRDVKITTDDPGSAYWIDHRRGDTMRPIVAATPHAWETMEKKNNGHRNSNNNNKDEGMLVYRGSAGIVATGTVPYYGGGLRLFPFARMTPNGMHLRIARELHPLEGVSKIPSIFEGSFRDKASDTFQCLDFVGHQFTVEIYESYKYKNGGSDEKVSSSSTSHETEKGFPVQHSGESLGRCTRVEFTVSSPSEVAVAERQHPNHHLAASDCSDPMPPPMRFVTLMPPRIVEERIHNHH